MRRRDRGQAVLLVIGVVVLLAMLAGGLARFGVRVVAKEQAQSAADAAALAGAVGGASAARDLAERNGGRLESFTIDSVSDPATVTVVVWLSGWTATARATRAP